MQGEQRRHRDWEHWPGRKQPDERIRHRLKALFSPTDDEATVEALIAERGLEIERQTEQLQETITDLERREAQNARLRSAVEEMLRHGSAELDERHAELAALAADLGARDEQMRALERDIAVRKQELGAVELRRAAVERREQALGEREASLERIAAELTAREHDLAEAEARLTELDTEIGNRQRALAASQAAVMERERRVGDLEQELSRLGAQQAERQRALDAERQSVAAGRDELSRAVDTIASGLRLPAPDLRAEPDPNRHLLCLASGGYRLVERDGAAPPLDACIEADGRQFVVTRVRRSPLPGDRRACAYLELCPPG